MADSEDEITCIEYDRGMEMRGLITSIKETKSMVIGKGKERVQSGINHALCVISKHMLASFP